ncbi:MAG: hypothetical protein NC924_06145, partial [Candidatus Omnitrophica bacterium]|nr:hypothetical protein [Candidatus Omnitrophota bacterium]
EGIRSEGYPLGTTEIAAVVTDHAGNTARKKCTILIYDSTPPDITLTAAAPEGFSTAKHLIISGVAQDIFPVEVAINGMAVDCPHNNFSLSVPVSGDGPFDFTVAARDSSGNVGTAVISFSRDTAAPQTTCFFPDDNRWIDHDAYIVFTAKDDRSGIAATYYRINSGDWKIHEQALRLTENGIWRIEYYSVDRAGNAEPVRELTVKINKNKGT